MKKRSFFSIKKNHYALRSIGYNLNIMRQSACLVFNLPMADNYAAFFNCLKFLNQSWLITMLPSLIAFRWVGRQTP